MTEIFNLLKFLIDTLWSIISFIIDIFELIFVVLPSSLLNISDIVLLTGTLGVYIGAIVFVLLSMGILRILMALK